MNANARKSLALTALLSLGLAISLRSADPLPATTAIDEYVATPDASYSWKIAKEASVEGASTYVIDMVSQTWRTPSDVDRTDWQHWLAVTVPEKASSDIALLWIGGGRNGGDPPEGPSERMLEIARATSSVVAELGMVPNQSLVFHGDGEERVEDDLIGYTWDQFLKTGDPTWPARNPMVKSAVRAMDTLTALTSSKDEGKHKVEKFVVAGGSKRGWTTWITGAVEPRVVAIIPIVIDVLNVKESMLHHFAAYGFWAPSVGDYVQHRIMERFEHPRMDELMDLVDPFSYRHRLTMPKFIINAAGDQFFLPDSSRFYFDRLEGEKYLRYVPNADHSLRGSDAPESIVAYHSLILSGKGRPRFSWTEEADGSFRVKTIDPARKVLLWQATNPAARDFRLETLGPKYTSSALEDQGGGVYVARVEKPEKGWTAYFVELEFDVGVAVPLKLTTSVRVVPDVLPYAGVDPTRPATVTIVFDAPSEPVARAIEGEVGKLLRAKKLAVGDVIAKRDGSRCRVNLRPTSSFRRSVGVLTGWLEEKDCSGFQYELHSGSEATD